MKVKRASLLEGHLDLYGRQVGRDAAAGDWLDEGSPDVGTEEGCGHMGVADVEERGGKGLEGVGLFRRKVDDLVQALSAFQA